MRLAFKVASANVFLLLLAIILFSSTHAWGQFTRTYGGTGLDEQGHVLLPERDLAGNLTGNLFIGGSREDSTLIMLVDPNGAILNEMTFKVMGPDSVEVLTDLRYDNNRTSLLGCGRIPSGGVHLGYAFRVNPTTNTLVWAQRLEQTSLCAAIMQELPMPTTQSQVVVFGLLYNGDHRALFARLNFATGALIAGSERIHDIFEASPDDHIAAEPIPGAFNTGYLSTGRWAYGSSTNKFRSNLFVSELNGDVDTAGILFDSADVSMRTYGMDIIATGQGTTTEGHILTFGDFSGTNLMDSSTFAISRHDIASSTMPWAFHYDIAEYEGETVQEMILNTNGNYIVYGNSNNTPNRLFLVEIDRTTGAVAWAWQFDPDATTNDLATHIAQSQVVSLNNSLYLIGSRWVGVTESDILLIRTTLGGEIPACDYEPINLAVTPEDDYFPFVPIESDTIAVSPVTPVVEDPQIPTTLNCQSCFAAADPAYTLILEDLALTGNHVWPAKVYLADDVSVTILDGTLDITNSDVVFGTCARIMVGDGGRLRLNNSVLRPCEETATWGGITFNGGSGIVNSSIFKNALTAIDMPGNTVGPTTFDVRITGNEFINCRRGVRLSNGVLTEGITGNHFTLDNRQIDYNPAPCETTPIYNNQHIGVQGTNATFRGLISHNQFINTSDPESPRQLFGVSWTSSSGSITGNRFTNNFEAISLSACTSIAIENNDIDLTLSMRTGTSAQIRVNSGGNTVWITGNRLVNGIENSPNPNITAEWSAIFLQSCRSINCKENEIEGFVNGIFAQALSSSNISENKIRNSNVNGIIVEDGHSLTVSCNEIWMRNFQTLAANVGINHRRTGAFPVGSSNTNQPRFISNCVFNARTAMQMSRTATTYGLPPISNNYFYNYTNFGLINSNFTGSVGTALAPFASTGHNTFVSNNVPAGVLDVSSNVAITVFGNFGVNNVSAGVTVMGNNLFNSNTACGHQIGATGEQYVPTDFCDQYTNNLLQGQLRISQGDYGPIHDLPAAGPQRLDLALAALAKLVMEDPDAAADLIAHLGTGLLTPTDLTTAQYHYHAWKGDADAAQAHLDQLAGSSPEWQALADIHGILRQEALSGNQPWSISAASVNALSAMDAARGPYAELARQILHNKDIDHNFIYPDAPEALSPPTEGQTVSLQTEQLLLAPNPATQTVTATLVMELPEGARLSVVDMLGREIFAQSVDANHQQLEMDIHTWAKGIYQVAIRRPGQPTLQQKLVKN